MKGNLNKTDFHKAMIAAWSESESEAETEIPVEEETTNLCLMASHDNNNEKSRGKEVMSSNSFLNHLFSLDKYKLIELLMERQYKLEEITLNVSKLKKTLRLVKTMFPI